MKKITKGDWRDIERVLNSAAYPLVSKVTAVKSTPGYGWAYRQLARAEDRHPAILYAAMTCLLVLPLLIAIGMAT